MAKTQFNLKKGRNFEFDLTKDEPEVPAPAPAPESEPEKPKNTWLWVVLGVVVVAVLAWLFWPSGQGDAAAVATVDSVLVDTVSPADTLPTDTASAEAPADEPVVDSTPAPEPAPAPALDVEAEALKVIRGDYGNNPDRRQRLGENYSAIQARVNELMENY